MNLVVGATGVLGTEICRLLREQSVAVRALVRPTADPAKVARLRELDVELVPGDLKQPDTLAAAVQGVNTILSTATSVISAQPGDSLAAVDDNGQRSLIDHARAARVNHFIFVSVSGAIQLQSALLDAKRAVEKHLMTSGIAYTILHAGAFMESWLGPIAGFDVQNRKATVFGDGHQRVSYVSLADVARFAIGSVGNVRAMNRVIEVGGPEPISPLQAVELFEQAAGDKFEVQHIPAAAIQAQYDTATDPVQRSFASIMLQLCRDDVIPMDATARDFGLKLRGVKDYVAQLSASVTV